MLIKEDELREFVRIEAEQVSKQVSKEIVEEAISRVIERLSEKDDLIHIDKLADRLEVTKKTIYANIKTGKFPPGKLMLGKRYFRKSEIMAFHDS